MQLEEVHGKCNFTADQLRNFYVDRTAFPCSGGYNRAQLLDIKAQMSSIWAKGSMYVDDCMCVI